MRLLYTFLFYLLVPLVLLRLFWRGYKAPDYRKRWFERLAIYQKKYSGNVIWIHAVSVGEAEAVFPLVKRLQNQYPSDNFLVTTTTPTGSSRVQAILADTITHVYLPYDLPCVIGRFLKIFKPKVGIIMEKEIWPNLYAGCGQNKIPLLIINARLSANSAKGYKKISGLVSPALDCVTWIATQTEEDKNRFIEIGAKENCISVAGNLKFDIELDELIIQQAKEIRTHLFGKRFIWIIASTHEHEEELFFQIYPQLKATIPELLLILVPRHPERFSKVKELAEKMKLTTCMRSSELQCSDDIDVYIADTMGELKLLYGTADICFVGGSMVPIGGHNILEPAAMNVPIMFGPNMVNFKEIARNVLEQGAAIQCADKDEIIKTVKYFYNDKNFRLEIASNAKLFLNNNQGATKKTALLISNLITSQINKPSLSH